MSLKETLQRIEKYVLMGTKDVLTLDEAATYLGLSSFTVRRLAHEHVLPYYKPNRNTMYFDKAELRKYMLQNREATNEELVQQAELLINKNKKL